MPSISVAKHFTLNLGSKGIVHVLAGVQNVSEEIADHWFTKLHLTKEASSADEPIAEAPAADDDGSSLLAEAEAKFAELEQHASEAISAAEARAAAAEARAAEAEAKLAATLEAQPEAEQPQPVAETPPTEDASQADGEADATKAKGKRGK